MVRRLAVTSSPTTPSPRVAPRTKHAVLVDQGDRQAVDLRLHHVVDLAGRRCPSCSITRRARSCHAPQLLGAAGVGEAQHGAQVLDGREPLGRRRPHPLGGRVGRREVRMLGLERLQLAHPVVVDDVLDRRLVQDVVRVVGRVDQAAQLGRPVGRRRSPRRPPAGRSSASGVSTTGRALERQQLVRREEAPGDGDRREAGGPAGHAGRTGRRRRSRRPRCRRPRRRRASSSGRGVGLVALGVLGGDDDVEQVAQRRQHAPGQVDRVVALRGDDPEAPPVRRSSRRPSSIPS